MGKEKTITITFRIREGVYKEVKKRAEKDGLSANSALHQRVVRDLENDKRRELNAQ